MSDLTTAAFSAMAAKVGSWRRPLLITHTKADGDGIGSILASRYLFRQAGCDPLAMLFEPVPDQYRVLEDPADPMGIWEVDVHAADLASVDAVIVLDTCSYAQLAPLADWLRDVDLPKLAVDHHVTRDELATDYLIDETAAANCVIIHDWAKAVGWTITEPAGLALFAGIATDTGWFRHANAGERVFTVAADLCGGPAGVKPHALFQGLYQQSTTGRIRLLGAAIDSMEVLSDGRLAVMSLPATAFAQCGAVHADSEDMVNEPMRIASVLVSVFLVEQGGLIRVGLRSRAPLDAKTPDIDVSAIARGLGGGGHRRASGARLTTSLSEAKRAVVEAVLESMS